MNRRDFLKIGTAGLVIASTLTSCKPKQPSVTSEILSSNQIKDLMHSGGYEVFNEIIYDAEYGVPNKEWITKEFYPKFWSFLKDMNLSYEKESQDCDDFAGWARLFAQKLNNETENRGKRAIAFGEFHYTKDSGEGHAINFALIKVKEDFKILFFEPQTADSVVLSKNEIASALTWII